MNTKYLESIRKQFAYYKQLGDQTFAQLPEEALARLSASTIQPKLCMPGCPSATYQKCLTDDNFFDDEQLLFVSFLSPPIWDTRRSIHPSFCI